MTIIQNYLKNKYADFLGKYSIKNQNISTGPRQHIMNKSVEKALKNGWAWEYKKHAKARGLPIYYDEDYYWVFFKQKMSHLIGVDAREIESIAFTNDDKDFSVQTPENQKQNISKVDISKFKFQKKNYTDSTHLYCFTKINGNWYGVAKFSGISYSTSCQVRWNGAENLVASVIENPDKLNELAIAMGFVPQKISMKTSLKKIR